MNVENKPLVEPSKILLPSIHFKLGMMKNFIKTTNQEEAAFTYLREKFPRLGEAKLKEYVSIDTHIQDLVKEKFFKKLFQGDEKTALDSFKFIVKVFSGNTKAQIFEELVNNLLQSYQRLCCNMSLKYTCFTRIWYFPIELWCSE